MRNFVAKSADLIGKIKLGEASTIWYQSVIRGDYGVISIGDRSNIQDGSVVHVDEQYPTVVGDDVTVGHRCIIHGCTIEDRVIVGMGSTIMNGAKIGQDSIVGANSLVTERKEFPPVLLLWGHRKSYSSANG